MTDTDGLKRLVLDFYRDTKAMIDELERDPPPAGSPEAGLLEGLHAACRGYEGRAAPDTHDPACDVHWKDGKAYYRRAIAAFDTMSICGPCLARIDPDPAGSPRLIRSDDGKKLWAGNVRVNVLPERKEAVSEPKSGDNTPRVDG